jgi:hypothetical protein
LAAAPQKYGNMQFYNVEAFERGDEENIWTEEDELLGGWRKLHNEKFHNLYSSPSLIRMIKSKRIRWAGYVPRMEAKSNTYNILVGKPEGKTTLGRS